MTLTKESKTWVVTTETEALDLIQQVRDKALENAYNVKKANYLLHTKKVKGEIVDSWYTVDVTLTYEE